MCAVQYVIDSCHSNCSVLLVFGYSVRAKGKKKGIVDSSEVWQRRVYYKDTSSGLVSTPVPVWQEALAPQTWLAGQLSYVLKGGQQRKCLFPMYFKLPIKSCSR